MGVGAAPEPSRLYSRLLAEPVPALVTLPFVLPFTRASRTAAGVAVGFAYRYRAATPATWGDAIDVPLMVLVALLVVSHALVMFSPGAKISRQVPKFEKEA